MKLFVRGRLTIGRDRVKGRDQLRAILLPPEAAKGETPS
jgi:hypothetical protein